MLNRKHIKVPKTYDPGGGRPKERLAYINKAEAELLRVLTDGVVERGPKGIPSFAFAGPGVNSMNAPARTAPSSASKTSSVGGVGAAAKSGASSMSSAAKSAPSSSSKSGSSSGNFGGGASKAPSAPSGGNFGGGASKASGVGAAASSAASKAQSASKSPSSGAKPSGGFSQSQFGAGGQSKQPSASGVETTSRGPNAAAGAAFSKLAATTPAAPPVGPAAPPAKASTTSQKKTEAEASAISDPVTLSGMADQGLYGRFTNGKNWQTAPGADVMGGEPSQDAMMPGGWMGMERQPSGKYTSSFVNAAQVPMVEWGGSFAASAARRKLSEQGDKLYRAIEDTALRTNQPITVFSGGRGKGDRGNHSKGYAIDNFLRDPVSGRPVGEAQVGRWASFPIAGVNRLGGRPKSVADKIAAELGAPYKQWSNDVYDTVYQNPEAYSGVRGTMRYGGDFQSGTTARDYMHHDVTPGRFQPNNHAAATLRARQAPSGPTTRLAGGELQPGMISQPPRTGGFQTASETPPVAPAAPVARPRPRPPQAGLERNPFDTQRAVGVPRARPPQPGLERNPFDTGRSPPQYSGVTSFAPPAINANVERNAFDIQRGGGYSGYGSFTPPPPPGLERNPFDTQRAQPEYSGYGASQPTGKKYYGRVEQTPGPQQPYQLPDYPGRVASGTYTAPYDAAGPRAPALGGIGSPDLPPGYAERYGLGQPEQSEEPASAAAGPTMMDRGVMLARDILRGDYRLDGDAIRQAMVQPGIKAYAEAPGWQKSLAGAAFGPVYGKTIRKGAGDAIRGLQDALRPPPPKKEQRAPAPEAAAEEPRAETVTYTPPSTEEPRRSPVRSPRSTNDRFPKSNDRDTKKPRSKREKVADALAGTPSEPRPPSGSGFSLTPMPPDAYYGAYSNMTPEQALRRMLGEEWYA
jgi:hypothetical protein